MIAVEGAHTVDLALLVECAVEVNGVAWRVVFADVLAPALLDVGGDVSAAAQAAIAGAVSSVTPPHRARLRPVIVDFHVLALILPAERLCRLYSAGATQESLLLKLTMSAQLQEHVHALERYSPILPPLPR